MESTVTISVQQPGGPLSYFFIEFLVKNDFTKWFRVYVHELPHPPPVFCTSMFFTIHKIWIIQSYLWPIAYFGLNVKRNPNKKTLKNLLVIEQVNNKMKGQMVLSSLNFLVAPWIQSCLYHSGPLWSFFSRSLVLVALNYFKGLNGCQCMRFLSYEKFDWLFYYQIMS